MDKGNFEITQDEIKQLFEYRDGRLYWKINCGSRAKKGNEAGSLHNAGYRRVMINGVKYLSHRLIWVLFNGRIPNGKHIDHQNHVRIDNRIENLRLVNGNCENMKNMSMPSNNKSGYAGVYWRESRAKWQAQIVVDGKNIYLGMYSKFDDAVNARLDAEKKYGFHFNHGKKNGGNYGEINK
ncbi:HNH endonuclease [Enterobacter sp. CPE_E1214]|uniref:HNH endonuclease n=1 Tax=unclassified Enterobacter TaxID=2608935 RepID=UPI00388E2F2B